MCWRSQLVLWVIRPGFVMNSDDFSIQIKGSSSLTWGFWVGLDYWKPIICVWRNPAKKGSKMSHLDYSQFTRGVIERNVAHCQDRKQGVVSTIQLTPLVRKRNNGVSLSMRLFGFNLFNCWLNHNLYVLCLILGINPFTNVNFKGIVWWTEVWEVHVSCRLTLIEKT